LCTAAQQAPHFIDLFPIPLALGVSAELPHRRDLRSPPVGAPSRRIRSCRSKDYAPGRCSSTQRTKRSLHLS
jgi:hypothetical protein